MRTTLTLEPDVALKLKRTMARRKVTLKQAVNDALRIGLTNTDKPPVKEFKVEPFSLRFRDGVDQTKLGQLVDEMDSEEFARKFLR